MWKHEPNKENPFPLMKSGEKCYIVQSNYHHNRKSVHYLFCVEANTRNESAYPERVGRFIITKK